MSDPIVTFQNEATEHLLALENALMDLEESSNDKVQIDAAFRSMHTIKGAAGMVGYDHISEFTHHIESLFDHIRHERLSLSADLCQLLLNMTDHIQSLLASPNPSLESKQQSEALIDLLLRFMPNEGLEDTNSLENPPIAVENTQKERSERYSVQIDVTPHDQSFRDGFDIIPVLKELHEMSVTNSFEVETKTQAVAGTEFDPEQCYLSVAVSFETNNTLNEITDVFMFVEQEWQVDIAHKQLHILAKNDLEFPSDSADLSQTLDLKQAHSNALRPAKYKQTEKNEDAHVRVAQHKLDMLMDQVGELVIMQAGLDQVALSSEHSQLQVLAEELQRLTNNLRDIAFDIRMLPIGSAFSRFKRLVRDLSKDLGKKVRLETSGSETELDKVVLDKLIEPLIHILRNSLDHGLERPEQRRENGKDITGLISLSAWHAQGQINIRIKDDGRGIDHQRVREKAIAQRLISADSDICDLDVLQLIFEAGFSTAQTVTDISGRGVGMDVVRSSIESLQGKVNILSETGLGTEVCIQLPMTLSIIDGLMISVAGEKFVIPLNQVQECIEHKKRSSTDLQINHRDKPLPTLRLRDRFDIAGQAPDIEQTVIALTDSGYIGITVDEIDGNHQTVIRNMGRVYQNTPGLMGATILGNGNIAMILDLSALAQSF